MAVRYVRQEVDAVTLDAVQECEEVELGYNNYRHLRMIRLCCWVEVKLALTP